MQRDLSYPSDVVGETIRSAEPLGKEWIAFLTSDTEQRCQMNKGWDLGEDQCRISFRCFRLRAFRVAASGQQEYHHHKKLPSPSLLATLLAKHYNGSFGFLLSKAES